LGKAKAWNINIEDTENRSRTRRVPGGSKAIRNDGNRDSWRVGREMWATKLEFKDHADGGFGAPLVGAEILGADGVGADAQRPAGLEGQVDTAAEGVGDGMLVAERRLGSEVGIADESMGPKFQTAARGPAETRATAAEGKPGTDVLLGAVRGGKIAFGADPVFEVINHVDVEAVHVLLQAGHFIKTEEGVTEIGLPVIGLENAGHILRSRRRRKGKRERRG